VKNEPISPLKMDDLADADDGEADYFPTVDVVAAPVPAVDVVAPNSSKFASHLAKHQAQIVPEAAPAPQSAVAVENELLFYLLDATEDVFHRPGIFVS
jgi:hypothetical protein